MSIKLQRPFIIVNSVELLYQAATAGLGVIALSSDSKLLEEGKLIRILPEMHSPEAKLYFVYHHSLKAVKLVRTLESYLVKCYKIKDKPKAFEK